MYFCVYTASTCRQINYVFSSFTGTTHQDSRPSSTSTSGEPHDVDWTGHVFICLLESTDPNTSIVAYCSRPCLANILQGCSLSIPILIHLTCEQIGGLKAIPENKRFATKTYQESKCLDPSQVDELHPSRGCHNVMPACLRLHPANTGSNNHQALTNCFQFTSCAWLYVCKFKRGC